MALLNNASHNCGHESETRGKKKKQERINKLKERKTIISTRVSYSSQRVYDLFWFFFFLSLQETLRLPKISCQPPNLRFTNIHQTAFDVLQFPITNASVKFPQQGPHNRLRFTLIVRGGDFKRLTSLRHSAALKGTADPRPPPHSVKCRGRISLHMLLTPTDILRSFS